MNVSVSVLNEYDRLINAVKKVNESNANFLHIDVMDGVFVNNRKFPIEVVKDVKLISKKKLDVHLMVDSHELIKEYINLCPDIITFHVEVIDDFELINYAKEKNVKVGLAINPETDVRKLYKYLNDINLVLFMSVNPGLPGQSFITDILEKIKKIKEKVSEEFIISIDGGINDETIKLAKKVGCNMCVSGSFITNSDDYNIKINSLR